MDGKTILPRSEVPEEFTWDLSDVFASDDKWSEELEALKAYPERMAAYAGKLGESAKTLLDWFTLSDEITVRVSKFVQYASAAAIRTWATPSIRACAARRFPCRSR